MSDDNFIEQQIVIGLIVSDDYIKEVRRIWNPEFLESDLARQMAQWCIEYFDQYDKAPFQDIESIYMTKLRNGEIHKDLAVQIEEDILPVLNDKYEQEGLNTAYLISNTKSYFRERQLLLHSQEISNLVDTGELTQAEYQANNFEPITENSDGVLDLSSDEATEAIDKAFDTVYQPVLTYPGKLGEMWNEQFVRGGLIGLMAPEKRGKTFWLLDIAMRATKQGSSVAFFQAGDMTEDQQLKRICVYTAGKSDKERYCGEIYKPVKDCVFNQLDTCNRDDRNSDCGLFNEDEWSIKDLKLKITADTLIKAYEENEDYKPCWSYICPKKIGTVWYNKVYKDPLTKEEAKNKVQHFFKNKQFKLSTHISDTLSVKEIKACLSLWEKQNHFIPDIIIIDYADLLISNIKGDYRHQQDNIWKGLRSLSQEKHCLVVTATQTDANSYEQNSLKLKNFSEDKRKYAHVTAMYGLNQDKTGREKKLGLMRINELLVREGDFSQTNQVTILQRLQIGKPFLGSF